MRMVLLSLAACAYGLPSGKPNALLAKSDGKEPYGPAIGATVSGGHAVTCYGWDVEADGTKYWKCINSWGSWGEHGKPKPQPPTLALTPTLAREPQP